MWRRLSGGARGVVIVLAVGVTATFAVLAADFVPVFFDPAFWSGDEEDPSAVPLMIMTFVMFMVMPVALAWLVGYLTFSSELDRSAPRPVPVRPTRDLPASGRPIATLCGLTGLIWFAWVGWDGRTDVDVFGNETGPWQPWQIVGLIVSIALLTVAAARRLPVGAVVSVIPTMVSTLFLLLAVFVIIPDPPYDTFDTLWIYVSFPIYLGTLICTVVLAFLARPRVRSAGPAGKRVTSLIPVR